MTLKGLLKVLLLAAIVAGVAAVVIMKKKSSDQPVSFESWPDVPRNAAA